MTKTEREIRKLKIIIDDLLKDGEKKQALIAELIQFADDCMDGHANAQLAALKARAGE